MSYRTDTFRIAMAGPADMTGLDALIKDGTLDPHHIAAILVKTEGNGGVNDFTREYTCATMASTLAPYLRATIAQVERRIAMVVSGGTEGVLSPHATIFAKVPTTVPTSGQVKRNGKRLAIGIAATRDFAAHEIGRAPQIEATATAVRAAMQDAGVTNVEDVHWVQVKCPLLTAERVQAARRAGQDPVTEIAYKSMAYSRGASALGVAVALGEITAPITDDAVLSDWSLASGVASASAGIELKNNIVIVLGNAMNAVGDCVIEHAVMQDAIDAAAIIRALRHVGTFGTDGINTSRIVNVLAKADPSPDGLLRGWRHTMLDDTDISATRHARAAVGGVIAGITGCPAIFVSGGAEHQGPPGGGPVAVISRV
jgi:cyanuric acid amidohydrolase